ncbi:phosphoribosyltransferase family protein [Thermovibrio sp.]
MKVFLNALLDLLFPQFCCECGSFLFLEHKVIACKRCWEREFKEFKGKKCVNCGHPLKLLPGSESLCRRCLKEKREFHFNKVSYYALYEGLAEKAITELKFGRLKPIAYEIGKEISYSLKEFIKETSADIVVPVPLHKKTLKERGFNQTEELLKGAKVQFKNILEKPISREKQSQASFKERQDNVRGLFSLKGEVKGKRVLVFDDVFTTGATVNEISRLLKERGAKEVFVYTVCYTPLRGYK